MIREITLPELSLCLEMAQSFFKEDIFIKTWESIYSFDMGKIHGAFYNDKQLCGCIGGIVYPDPNTGDLLATEMFWYVMPEFRKGTVGLRLLDCFENWAKQKKADKIIMVHLSNLQSDRISTLYKRKGYTPIETHYIKEVRF